MSALEYESTRNSFCTHSMIAVPLLVSGLVYSVVFDEVTLALWSSIVEASLLIALEVQCVVSHCFRERSE
jgi:hypothetical protein